MARINYYPIINPGFQITEPFTKLYYFTQFCRLFNRPFHSSINLHFTDSSRTKARRRVLEFSSSSHHIFLWLKLSCGSIWVFIVVIIIVVVYFLHYNYQITDSSEKQSQMKLSNWTLAEPPAYQTTSLIPLSAGLHKIFREPRYDVMKGSDMSCNPILVIKGTLTRAREAS